MSQESLLLCVPQDSVLGPIMLNLTAYFSAAAYRHSFDSVVFHERDWSVHRETLTERLLEVRRKHDLNLVSRASVLSRGQLQAIIQKEAVKYARSLAKSSDR